MNTAKLLLANKDCIFIRQLVGKEASLSLFKEIEFSFKKQFKKFVFQNLQRQDANVEL